MQEFFTFLTSNRMCRIFVAFYFLQYNPFIHPVHIAKLRPEFLMHLSSRAELFRNLLYLRLSQYDAEEMGMYDRINLCIYDGLFIKMLGYMIQCHLDRIGFSFLNILFILEVFSFGMYPDMIIDIDRTDEDTILQAGITKYLYSIRAFLKQFLLRSIILIDGVHIVPTSWQLPHEFILYLSM